VRRSPDHVAFTRTLQTAHILFLRVNRFLFSVAFSPECFATMGFQQVDCSLTVLNSFLIRAKHSRTKICHPTRLATSDFFFFLSSRRRFKIAFQFTQGLSEPRNPFVTRHRHFQDSNSHIIDRQMDFSREAAFVSRWYILIVLHAIAL
jgi:hypothetical protein